MAPGTTAYEKLTGEQPMFKHVRAFVCAAFIYNTRFSSKIHAKAISSIRLGVNDRRVYIVERLAEQRV